MILLINPKSTRPLWRRFPLSLMALGASLPPGTSWEIWDGNKPEADFHERLVDRVAAAEGSRDPVRLLAITVMPGPQLVSAAELSALLKARFPRIPVVWGGYFPSLYPRVVFDASYVDWVIRGQGEQTLAELLEVLDGRREPSDVEGLAYRGKGGHQINPERPWVGPDEFPSPPYDRIDVEDYLGPTSLGRRSGVYQASIGCPYACNFCGVISVFGRKEKFEAPARVAASLTYLRDRHGMDSVHFYDNNFFIKEAHAEEMCERLAPLGLNWWCETRIDGMLRFSDATWRKIEGSGAQMIFFGAESGSDAALRAMSKNLTTAQTVEIAKRLARTSIIPEFSFVLGGPDDPDEEISLTLDLIRKLKRIIPQCEIIFHYYTPMPRWGGSSSAAAPPDGTPSSIEEWCEPDWVEWMTFQKPRTPWMNRRLWNRVADFQTVLESRYPPISGPRLSGWTGRLVERLARRRWDEGRCEKPRLLRAVRTLARRVPQASQAYGHLRPPRELLSPKEGYGLWAANYEIPNGLTHLDELAVQRLSPRSFERLLDAGCGTALRMPSNGSCLAVGVDLTSEMLSVGKARGETRLINADIRALPVCDKFFDLVWCRLVLSHLSDVGAAYEEMGRASVPGATLIVTDLYVEGGAAALKTSFTDPSGTTRFIEVFPRAVVDHARIARDAGFDLQETFYKVVGPESRQFFEEAGELARYEQQKGRRVLVAMKFVKRAS